MTNEEDDKRLSSVLSAFSVAAERADRMVRADQDLDRAFQRADAASEHVRKLYEDLTALRSQVAKRIYETEKVSLSVLAERWSVSKTRAGQIIRAAKPQGDSPGGENA
ncbi:hypothetical protein [Nonomuraea ceibae]|uniref:hypothetical protein n=1 Tax=Nonomuraea ceibae TaxID=1935170 RepID=UPI001C5D45D2|nr:hypothetical protein [Nonomuraea ceibae]